MYFAGNYRRIGTMDVAPLRTAVDAIGEDEWNASRSRQTMYRAHASTQTLRLIYDEDMRHDRPTRHPLFDRLEDCITPAMTRIRDYFAPMHAAAGTSPETGYFARVVIVRLPELAEVLSHTDHGPSLSRAHRVHLPIVTNERALFAVAGEIRHLPSGELWEINNRRPHAVRNGGPARIHAILDYVVPGERVDDPDGPIVA